MKTKEQIEQRCLKLIDRYRRQYVTASTDRSPSNCLYNLSWESRNHVEDDLEKYVELAPRKVSTLIVLNKPSPIRVCGYGSDDLTKWNGDICDTKEVSSKCPYFLSVTTKAEATKRFDDLMLDDRWVMDNHPDLANLQWVLENRKPGIEKNVSLLKRYFIAFTHSVAELFR